MAKKRDPVKKQSKWSVGDRVEVDFDGTPYGGKIVKLSTHSAIVHFDDGEDHEIDLESLVKGSPAVMPDSGDGDDEDDSDDTVDYSVGKGDKVLRRDGAGKPNVIKQPDGSLKFNPPAKGFGRAAHHFPVVWDERGCHFEVWAAPDGEDVKHGENAEELMKMLATAKNKMVRFTGEARKTRFARSDDHGKVIAENVPGLSIDIRATIIDDKTGAESRYLVESIRYEQADGEPDPRTDMRSLNSDICAAIRKWFFFDVRGDAETIRQLKKRADHPLVIAPSLEWFDQMVLRLHETRDTALRAGGQRSVVIETGTPGDSTFTINMDFSSTAIVNKGKVPDLKTGGMIERIAIAGGAGESKRKKATGSGAGGTSIKPVEFKPDPKNVADLTARVAELNKLAKQGDAAAKSEARKIRAALRKMGHAGGARSSVHA